MRNTHRLLRRRELLKLFEVLLSSLEELAVAFCVISVVGVANRTMKDIAFRNETNLHALQTILAGTFSVVWLGTNVLGFGGLLR